MYGEFQLRLLDMLFFDVLLVYPETHFLDFYDSKDTLTIKAFHTLGTTTIFWKVINKLACLVLLDSLKSEPFI